MQNDENTNLANTSGSTTGSTGEQPTVQAPVQPLDIDGTEDKTAYIQTGWQLEELRKVKRTRAKIIAMYKALKRPHVYNAVKHLEAVEFFRSEWLHRSPYAVYQKAHILKTSKKIFVV